MMITHSCPDWTARLVGISRLRLKNSITSFRRRPESSSDEEKTMDAGFPDCVKTITLRHSEPVRRRIPLFKLIKTEILHFVQDDRRVMTQPRRPESSSDEEKTMDAGFRRHDDLIETAMIDSKKYVLVGVVLIYRHLCGERLRGSQLYEIHPQ